VTETVLESVLSYVTKNRFCPSHMDIIDDVPEELLRKTESQNIPPVMLPEIPILMMAADSHFIDEGVNDYISGTATSFGMRDQFSNSVITGVTSKGLETNLSNMAMNQGDVDNVSNELLISGVLMLMHDSEAYRQEKVDVQIPEKEELKNLIKNYKSGTGVIPATNYVTKKVSSDGIVTTTKKKPKTKDALADFLSTLITETLEEIFESGEIRDKVFRGVALCTSARKFEILNVVESINLEDLETGHSKLRLFFVESAHCIFLSYIAMKGIFDYLSRNGWEAGTSLNDGGFYDIFMRHSCGTMDYEVDKYSAFYDKYPFLRARSYFEGDMTKFDQSLLFRVLGFVGIFFASWYNLRNNFNLTIAGNIIFRLMFKYLYIVPLQQLYAVQGMMFSGMFETSHGDTAYQMIVFFCYLSDLLTRFKDHPQYSVLKEAIDIGLVQKSFMGDDTLVSWPTIFKDMFGMTVDAYRDFCKRFGLKFKYFFEKPLIGCVVNTKIGDVWQTVQTLSSVTFLKNSMCFNFDSGGGNDGMVGLYPYRSAYDLKFRIGNSDRANATIDGFMAKLISVAYLSVGNRQVYTYVRLVYDYAIKLYGKPFFDKERLEALMKGSGALYNLLQNVEDFEFPEFETLRTRHDRHVVKPRKRINMKFGSAREVGDLSTFMGISDDFVF